MAATRLITSSRQPRLVACGLMLAGLLLPAIAGCQAEPATTQPARQALVTRETPSAAGTATPASPTAPANGAPGQRVAPATPERPDVAPIALALVRGLAASGAMQGRGPNAEPWVIALDRVRHVSAPAAARERAKTIIEDVRTNPAIEQFSKRYNVRFVMPDRAASPAPATRPTAAPGTQPDAEKPDASRPTHSLTITFRPVGGTAIAPQGQTYRGRFSLMDLRTGRAVWKRQVTLQHEPKRVRMP